MYKACDCFETARLAGEVTMLQQQPPVHADLVAVLHPHTHTPLLMQFDAAGNPPFIARQLCFLPADAEFAARADTRAYLTALTQTNSLSISNAACNPVAPYSPVGSCLPTLANPTCTNRYAPWVPFKVLSERNMCNK